MQHYQHFDKLAIARAFNRAASHYDDYAALQREIGHELILFAKQNQQEASVTLLDAGAGSGYFSRYWQQQGYRVTAADLAKQMLQQAALQNSASHYVECDIEALPFISNRFNMSFSNLALQWCEDLAHALAELVRVSRQQVMFTTLLSPSLYELSASSYQLDGCQRVNAFLSLESVLAACPTNSSLRWQTKTHQLHYADIRSLLNDLKGVGATHLHTQRKLGLTSRYQLQALEQLYREKFGELVLSYQVFYGVITKDDNQEY